MIYFWIIKEVSVSILCFSCCSEGMFLCGVTWKKLVGIKERCTRTVKNMNELSLLNKKEGVKLVCFCLELDLIFFHKFNLL